MFGRPESFVSAIGVSEHVGVHYAAVQAALNCDGLALRNYQAILAARSGVDQGATAAILYDELVAKDLGDVAFDRCGGSLGHPVDRARLQQHHAPRLPVLGEPSPARAQRGAGDQHNAESASREATT
jgi:hypothetical protein